MTVNEIARLKAEGWKRHPQLEQFWVHPSHGVRLAEDALIRARPRFIFDPGRDTPIEKQRAEHRAVYGPPRFDSDDYNGFVSIDEANPLARLDDAVDHPSHYGGGDDPFETIKVIEARGFGFNLGNAYKYMDRAGKKGDRKEDLQKAAFYLQREIDSCSP